MYYNTTNLQGKELQTRREQTASQEKTILAMWRKSPKLELIPERFEFVFPFSPLTSIRRAFNTLERMGMIEKTGRTAPGHYGHNVNVYKLK